MPTISINNAEYYYELHGQGQPLVLIAGYTVDHTGWLPILDELAKHFHVLVFDNRGVGQTKDDGRVLTADLLAQDIVTLFTKLNLNKPHIAGHSMGGSIAQRIASHYPDKINKLVILNSTVKWRAATRFTMDAHIALREHNVPIELLLDNVLGFIFGEKFLSDPNNIDAFKKIFLSNPFPQSLTEQKRQNNILHEFNGTQDLQKIIAPTLVVHGIEDELVFIYESELLAAKIVNAELVTIQCGHATAIEASHELTKTLIKFLK